MSARSLLLCLSLAAAAGCLNQEPPAVAQPRACADALACYFGDDPATSLATLPGYEGVALDFDPALVEATYGPAGSCWQDAELAASCEERCRGLLWQDCAAPYADLVNPPAELPTEPRCPSACNPKNAPRCETVDGAASACPDGAVCNAPTPAGEGCCAISGRAADCASEIAP